MAQVIVLGGGLAGMSAAHTILEQGGRVVLIDKSPFCGGNSTKATSGINAAGSRTQRILGIPDSPELFEKDTTVSAAEGARPDLIHTLTHESGPAVDWLMDAFGLDLTIVARLAAHSEPRTHRGKERFPGMMITYGLMERLDEIAAAGDGRARVINKAEANKLITNAQGEVIGVEYVKGGKTYKEMGPVVIATGGFGADFTDNSLLAQVEDKWSTLGAWQPSSRAGTQSGGKKVPSPGLRTLPTTNGPHCTGDGLKMAMAVGADTYDLHCVQVHPTGLIDPEERDAKVKFLAAEALRGSGGIILDREGNRFCDELGKRDYVTGRMWLHNKAPYRLVLNGKATDLISWHCEHYEGRGLMKQYTGEELIKEMGISRQKLQSTFDEYNKAAANPGTDKWGKKFFEAVPQKVDDKFMVAEITPVVHYCMGGIAGDKDGRVLDTNSKPIPGLFVTGEALGGVHGVNRLGGSSLLDCVVYGRVSGRASSKFLLEKLISQGSVAAVGGAAPAVNVRVKPDSQSVSFDISWGEASAASAGAKAITASDGSGDVEEMEEDPNAAFYAQGTKKKSGGDAAALSAEEVAKHNTDKDCWVILEGFAYDVTEFLDDHPGGKKAIMLYAGKDATKEFAMLHKPEILTKYAAEFKLGPVAGAAKL
uniref:fumarate reductase (NADH) n=2 Tax=Sar TaxID=2698737 RepID=A0A7S3LPT8_9STRA|mmetsp:Transcript_6632/g.8102  ORF Transcript_6632/g.8102 Transcript_6632/m.8102 type:complete len:650 (-) Transcript_6632:234-2183(-)|eukprot:CAMPEP_0204824046 /NCGR_PEP_ID=MMETSP1346-20131115/2101_1 /ASSEMBLY_ACC=CAM_ASM_000771 /TAXON_ID=215587 /ORGANISM="Aplanochytrium stocchinoi, Strain GSBS06" /LENGTH=649 /DNA_ID=CAMNT_0051950995 /DNA_START=145 /DNA_END=2094 /DNA_ORIENTATION=+